MFNSLHLMFENQYNELATAVDDIAERIRSLKLRPAYHEFSRLTAVNEDKDIPQQNMIENLVRYETVVKTARPCSRSLIMRMIATADLLTQRIQLHEKTA